MGRGPVDACKEALGGVVVHRVDRVDDLLTGEVGTGSLETLHEQVGVQPAEDRVLALLTARPLQPLLVELHALRASLVSSSRRA